MAVDGGGRLPLKGPEIRITVQHIGKAVMANDVLMIPGPGPHMIGAQTSQHLVDQRNGRERKMRTVMEQTGWTHPVAEGEKEGSPPVAGKISKEVRQGSEENKTKHYSQFSPGRFVR
jgi:hypothetical protein